MAEIAFKALLMKLSMQVCLFIWVGWFPSDVDLDKLKYTVAKVIFVVLLILRSLLSYRGRKKVSKIWLQDDVSL